MKEFIINMLSNKEDISSKRFNGMLLVFQYFTMIYLSIWFNFNEIVLELAKTGLWAGLVLLGFTSIEKTWIKK